MRLCFAEKRTRATKRLMEPARPALRCAWSRGSSQDDRFFLVYRLRVLGQQFLKNEGALAVQVPIRAAEPTPTLPLAT